MKEPLDLDLLGDGVHHVWTTLVGVSRVDVDQILRREFSPSMDGSDESRISLEPANHFRSISDVKSLFAKAAAAITQVGLEPEVRLQVLDWHPGYEVPLVTSNAECFGWLFLAGSESQHSDAGTVAIADPRSGSNMVALPGLPWGRPLVISPRKGTLIVAPSWLTASVLPLDPLQRVLVAFAEVYASDGALIR